ncbi:hypothetical protein GCM10027036_16240 [Flavihumibacter cheonanensis]|jgi:hypothetical protein|uniref:hypothetical protein n=1 Tax=Flavihumibacter cheonanensis TaxID=1442385 RepID=UPI001EF83135|nr:hypothetical protein [Flavihumibacter cheonanensis]MCG7750935.1 hypothetical protein [Flavihumibacter cheonanensis]
MNKIAILLVGLLATSISISAQKSLQFSQLQKKGKLVVVNRTITVESDERSDYIKVSESEGEGIIWLPVGNISTGIFTLELRGKDEFQKSFVGIVFNGQNDSTYEAVYCRPFNFLATDSVRRIHAIQYIAHPEYTWKRLRDERNAEFENAIQFPPEPNNWFSMTIHVTDTEVIAMINGNASPALKVNRLRTAKSGKIGIFLGAGSGGDFRKLVYTGK